MKKSGFKVRPQARAARYPHSPPTARCAPWRAVHELGVVRDPSEAALARYVRRIGGTDDLRWNRGVRRVD